MSGLIGGSVPTFTAGASEVKTARGERLNSSTRITLATPASGKKARIIAAWWRGTGSTSVLPGFYFGTGTNIETNAGNEIYEQSGTLLNATGVYMQGNNIVFPDGGGPVGSVDEVISCSTQAGSNTEIAFTVLYREE